MSSVETLGRCSADCPTHEEPLVETTLRLDREIDRQLLYLSGRFGVPKADLIRELVRATVKDLFEVLVPGGEEDDETKGA